MKPEPSLTVISLGGGVQSSVMALMANEGAFDRIPDCAIFADTRWEPPSIYEHLTWLRDRLSFPLYVVDNGRSLRGDVKALTNHRNSPRVLIGIPQHAALSCLTDCIILYHTASRAKHIAARVAQLPRKRRMISYPIGVTPDPEQLLNQLRECRDSPYWNRSLSDIGGMVLLKGAEAELEKYDSQQEIQTTKTGA